VRDRDPLAREARDLSERDARGRHVVAVDDEADGRSGRLGDGERVRQGADPADGADARRREADLLEREPHARRRRELGKDAPAAGSTVFLAGYLIAWTLYGLAAYGVIEAARALDIDALAWNRAGPYVAGAVILAAAAYQLTPAKEVCLRKCRSPIHFFFGIWRDGMGGALRMGIEHGAWCVGCCWALMAALFALGAMSVGWMALVAAFIAIEKLLPWKALANHGVAVVLVVLGLAVIATPASVPGLGPASMSMLSESMSNGSGASMSQPVR
jgi:hypothetical protein